MPRCEAPIIVCLVDRATQQPVVDVPELELEAILLNGLAYDEACVEGQGPTDLSPYELPLNNSNAPLLQPRSGGVSDANSHAVTFRIKPGSAPLPEMYVTGSSEALLSGRKPPFRLVVRVAPSSVKLLGGRQVTAAVSDPFVVATKRVRTAGKVDTPCINDDLSKLKHMGKETVRKLADLTGAAAAVGIELPGELPDNCVSKVRDFQRLAHACERDPQLALKLQSLLKLNKGRWAEACEHAASAVHPDSRMRIWYADKLAMDTGLLFGCRLGNVDLERPLGLLQRVAARGAGEPPTMSVTLTEQQTPAQREQALMLKRLAADAWWQQGHPGWAIHPSDSEHFLESDMGPWRAPAGPSTNARDASGSGRRTASNASSVQPPRMRSTASHAAVPPAMQRSWQSGWAKEGMSPTSQRESAATGSHSMFRDAAQGSPRDAAPSPPTTTSMAAAPLSSQPLSAFAAAAGMPWPFQGLAAGAAAAQPAAMSQPLSAFAAEAGMRWPFQGHAGVLPGPSPHSAPMPSFAGAQQARRPPGPPFAGAQPGPLSQGFVPRMLGLGGGGGGMPAMGGAGDAAPLGGGWAAPPGASQPQLLARFSSDMLRHDSFSGYLDEGLPSGFPSGLLPGFNTVTSGDLTLNELLGEPPPGAMPYAPPLLPVCAAPGMPVPGMPGHASSQAPSDEREEKRQRTDLG